MNNMEGRWKFIFFLFIIIGFIGFCLPFITFFILFTRPEEWQKIYGREYFFKYCLTSCLISFLTQLPIVYLVRKDWEIREFSNDKETYEAYYIGSCGWIGALCYWHKYKRKMWKPK